MLRLRYLLILVCALCLTACSPLQVLNTLTPKDTYTAVRNVAYGNHPRQRLDIYQPRTTNQRSGTVLVFFYGGAWREGERADYQFLAEAFAAEGMTVVIPDYRLYPEVVYPAFLEDSAQAVAWIKKNIDAYNPQAEKIYLMGHSAGAYHAAMLALDQRWLAQYQMEPKIIAGWIGIAGPYNFLPITYDPIKPVFPYPGTPIDTQPIKHATRNAPPALLIASSNDETVYTPINTHALAARLQELGVPVQTKLYDRFSHTSILGAFSRTFRHWAPIVEDIKHFISTESQTAIQREANTSVTAHH